MSPIREGSLLAAFSMEVERAMDCVSVIDGQRAETDAEERASRGRHQGNHLCWKSSILLINNKSFLSHHNLGKVLTTMLTTSRVNNE